MNKNVLKAILAAWALPLAIIVTVLLLSPDPNRPIDSFQSAVFQPSEISTKRKLGSKRSDHFELWLHAPSGDSFFFRNPNEQPIADLSQRIPRDTPLKVVYSPTRDGNELMQISLPGATEKPILAFEDVMAEYSSRRRLVYIIAAIWFIGFNLLAYFLWKTRTTAPTIAENTIDLQR
jgi:hypothetical protein